MKYLLTLIILIALQQVTYSQQSCLNFGKVKTLMQSADLKHQGTLKQIRLYWSKRCACESGSITGGDWKYTVEVANRVYDNYQAGKLTNDYSGPTFPAPDRRLTVNDCGNDSHNPQIHPDISDCKTNTFTKEQDPQQYGNQFMLDRCECINGVPNEERAKQLVAQMKINKQNCATYYGNSFDLPPVPNWDDCKIMTHGDLNNQKTVDYNNKRLVKNEYFELLDMLAVDSKSFHFKNMVDEMKSNRDDFAQGRNIAMQFGTISQQDMDAYNMFENISQGIAIGKFIYNELSNALTPEQEAARKYIQGLYTELNAVYKEVSYVPNFKTYDDGVLDYLSQKEGMINQYEQATATKRLLYLEYWYQNKPYMTIEQLQNKANELESLKNSKGTQYLVNLIEQKAKPFEKKIFMPITNKEYGFKSSMVRLRMNEANYYEANGNKSKAEEIRKTIDYDVNNFDAFKLLDESFASKDYFGSIAYYEQVKEIIRINENGNNFFMFYKNIPSITFNQDGVWRHEATYLLALGVLSNFRVGNISQAEEEFLFLKEYNENHRRSNEEFAARPTRKKLGKFTEIERQTSYGQCLAIEKAVESILFAKNGKFEEANKSIVQSIKLLNDNPLMNKYYNAWIELLKFETEIRVGDFSAAKRTAIGLKSRIYTANQVWVKLFTNEDYQYHMAYMKFKQKQYQSCINQLKILEAANPKSKRVLLLKLDTYKALGDVENSIKTENQLIQN